jgi:SAM-dependent methyltransferase
MLSTRRLADCIQHGDLESRSAEPTREWRAPDMNESASKAQIEAARLYETLFVPAVFAPWATLIADAAQIEPGQQVLDVACGTGILARAAHQRVGPHGRVVGLDPSQAMLAIAQEIAPAIIWQCGRAEAMPMPDRSYDAVVCQFGLMFFADRKRALGEMLRVLVPGGRLIVAVWDLLANIRGYGAFVDFIERRVGRQLADGLRTPFALGHRADLTSLFAEAGAILTAIATHRNTARYAGIRVMAEATLRLWLPATGLVRTAEEIESILQEAERDLAAYVDAESHFTYETQAHIVTAIKP